MNTDCFLSKYRNRLSCIPTPGGNGCHPALLGTANLGILAGLAAEQIFSDIRSTIPGGTRRISDREIQEAINKAMQDHNGGTYTPRTRPAPFAQDGKAALQRIINQGKISDEAYLWEASPLRLWEEPQDDRALLIDNLFLPDDLIFIGERHQTGIIGSTIRTALEWINHLKNGEQGGPFIIINPLNGIPAPTKTGDKPTLRGDGNISTYRYAMAEFDGLNREDQIRFWSAVKLPIVALIDSGGKSVHAWLQVSKLAQVETSDEIKGRLYDRILTPLGIDAAYSNPARLSRLPGHFREEKQAYQRLLWLSSEGRPIC
jgi:hypothetical protein